MVGGDVSTLERIRPVLAAFATTIHHVGALGDGHRLKLVNNFISLGYAALYSEALALAIKGGLTAASFDDLVRSSRMHCAFYDTFMGWVISGDRQSHPYALDDALRTISDVVAFSRSVRLKGRLAGSVSEIFAEAVADGFGAAMLPELPRAVASANDIDLRPASAERGAVGLRTSIFVAAICVRFAPSSERADSRTGKNPLRADFDVADVLRHCLRSVIGVARGNSRSDFRMIRRALGDQTWLVSSAPVEVLEVEPQIVQVHRRSAEARRCQRCLKASREICTSRIRNPTGSS